MADITSSHGGLEGLVEQLFATLRRDREDAQIAVQRALRLQRIQLKQTQARLQQLYEEYQADWEKANGLAKTVVHARPGTINKEK